MLVMKRRFTTRAVSLLLALFLPLAALRALPSSCADDDCSLPCCKHSDGARVLPILPCCRAIQVDEAPSSAPPAVHGNAAPIALISGDARVTLTRTLFARVFRAPPSPHLRAPPLYQQNCARLL